MRIHPLGIWFISLVIVCLSAMAGKSQTVRVGIFPVEMISTKEYSEKSTTSTLWAGTTYREDYNTVLQAQASITQAFLADSRFEVVDRSTDELVEEELYRQKSESYIDGYIVEQGKLMGVDFLVRSQYNPTDKTLAIQIISVSDNKSKGGASVPLKRNLLLATKFLQEVKRETEKLIIQIWPIEILLHEVIEQNSKEVKKVLAVSLQNVNLAIKAKMQVYYTSETEVNGVMLQRDKVVGFAEVEIKENSNFYVFIITSETKKIKQLIDKGVQLKFKIYGI